MQVLGVLCLLILNDVRLCNEYERADTLMSRSRSLEALSRQGGSLGVVFLSKKHERMLAAQRDLGSKESTVELLMALRRLQGKPTPLAVTLKLWGEHESVFPNLPRVEAAIENHDSEREPIIFQEGGDYRSGRQARWRFHVCDARGQVLPVDSDPGYGRGGGLFQMGVLQHKESWKTTLVMRKFIGLPPGDYTVVVEYHDELTIADFQDTAGLLRCRSKPFKLHVQPRVIDLMKSDRVTAREAIAAFPDEGVIKFLEGPYARGSHDFIPPESAAGRLLTLGWKAVPSLLDALEDGSLTNQQRAWIFAILYSITGWHDPRQEQGLIADYECREGSWIVSGGRSGEDIAQGGSLGGVSKSSGGKLHAEAQRTFIKRWKAARDYVVVREKPE